MPSFTSTAFARGAFDVEPEPPPVSNDRALFITWAEFEVPTAPRRLLVTWAELEVPDVPPVAATPAVVQVVDLTTDRLYIRQVF